MFTQGVDVVDGTLLLHMAILLDPALRVNLDVGAQVLELTNEGKQFSRLMVFRTLDVSCSRHKC